uniref:DUF3419 family protein n=1 Tax=candidate division WOR-3 bacterium TaxID=2052148 RepID=A0A7C4YHU6_UNCW3
MLKEKFEIIRYSNCWEDTEVLLKALNVKIGGKYLSIISGGDNTLSLLVKNPSFVVGIDISPAQIALFHLKIASFKLLSHIETLEFFGVKECKRRIEIYDYVKKEMPDSARFYWDNHKGFIEKGIIFVGKFEKYFEIFRRFVIPIVHRRKTIEKMFNLKTKDERIEFFEREWNNFQWKLMFKIFFGKFLMGKLGRDPEFFKYVSEPIADSIKKTVDRGIINVPASDNPYIDFIFHGNYKLTLPFYLKEENYEIIKKNLEKIIIIQGPVEKGLNSEYDGFNLSDIFEYIDYNSFRNIYKMVLMCSKKGSRIFYRNMLVPRRCPKEFINMVISHRKEAQELLETDRAFFYRDIIIEEKI